jgi:hypothetical protein
MAGMAVVVCVRMIQTSSQSLLPLHVSPAKQMAHAAVREVQITLKADSAGAQHKISGAPQESTRDQAPGSFQAARLSQQQAAAKIAVWLEAPFECHTANMRMELVSCPASNEEMAKT